MKRRLLKGKYDELSLKHMGLIKVPPERISQLQQSLKDIDDISGIKYYVVTLAALFFIGTAPMLIANYFELCTVWEASLFELLSQNVYLSTHQSIHISLVFLAMAIPLYTLWLPFTDFYRKKFLFFSRTPLLKKLFKNKKFGKFSVLRRPLSHSKESKTFFFYTYIAVINYGALAIYFLYLISFNILSEEKLHWALLAWLMLPSPIIAVAPSLLLIAIGVALSRTSLLTSAGDINKYPSRIVLELLLLLEAIDKLKERNDLESGNRLSVKILRISSMISDLHLLETTSSVATQQIKDKFTNAAVAFESLIPLATLTKPDSLAQLRKHTIRTANIFLTGNLGNLADVPYTKSGAAQLKIGAVRKALSILGLLVYLLVPIVLWAFAADLLALKLDDASKTLLTVLYSLWAVTGIVSFSGNLATEVKELLTSMLKQKFKAND